MMANPNLFTRASIEQTAPAKFMVKVQYGFTPAVIDQTTTTIADAIAMITTLVATAVVKNDHTQ